MPRAILTEEQLLEYLDDCIETHAEQKNHSMMDIDSMLEEKVKIETLQNVRMAVFGEMKE